MPFVKKNDARGPQFPNDTGNIFVGRSNELHFFTEYILQPDDPAYNIISIYGDGGVGKSTLITRLSDEASSTTYRDYCLTATVDERQATAASMIERFADQLQMRSDFKKALTRYKATLRKLHDEQETMQDAVLQRAPDFAGAAVEGVPVFGPLLREGIKLTTAHALQGYRSSQAQTDAERLDDPIGDLTRAFITEINRLADTQVTLSAQWSKRRRRIVLFFDTFEQLADEAAPWLLDYFLTSNISSNVVLFIAGRVPIERSIPDDPKRWLPYLDQNVIYSFSLNSFSEQETRSYLEKRGITDPVQINRIWQLSRGLPLYLSLLTAHTRRSIELDPTADVVANFLRWIPEHEEIKRRLVLDAALFSRPFNQDELAALTYIPEQERPALYRWLIKQPFVHKSQPAGCYSYHELAEDLFSRHLYQLSPNASYATRLALIDYYQASLEKLHRVYGNAEIHLSSEWVSLILALTKQMFLLPDRVYHIQAIEELLSASKRTKQTEEIARMLRDLSQEQLYNLANADARHSALTLLRYISLLEEEQLSQEFLAATDDLLTRITSSPTFSPELLAYVYTNRGATQRKLLYNYQQALADFNRAIELSPHSAEAYGNRGITYRFLKQYPEALDDCNTALTLDTTLDEVYIARGEVYRHLRQQQLAIADFDRAIELNPDYAPVYVSRGRAYRTIKRYKQAIEDFNYAIELNPQFDLAYAHRGETYLALKEYEWAVSDYTKAIVLSPEYFWAYASRGRAHFSFKAYPLAIADYDRAIELNPSYTWAFGQRGKVYRHLKDYLRALADFDRAIELDPRNGWAFSHRGLTYASLHEYHKAIADITRAIELNPGYRRSYSHRGSAYLGLKDLQQARADYEHNSELTPKDIRVRWTTLWIEFCESTGKPGTTGQGGRIREAARLISPRERGNGGRQQLPDASTVQRLEEIAATAPDDPLSYLCRGVALWLRASLASRDRESYSAEEEPLAGLPEGGALSPMNLSLKANLPAAQQALAMLQQTISIRPATWDAYFWQGMIHASQGQSEAIDLWEQALQLDMPPILLMPLRWLQQDQLAFYEQYAAPLLARYEL